MTKILFVILSLCIRLMATDAIFPWVVYYGPPMSQEAFEPYNPIVLQNQRFAGFDSLLNKKKQILGYVDLTEAWEKEDWFSKVKDQKIIIKENTDWPGTWSVDIRHPMWQDLLINKVIPDILELGFTGLLLDQADVAIALEKQDPKKYKGMANVLVDLVQAIRKKFPNIRIMLNRGYEILPQVGEAIDYILAESLYTTYDFKLKKYFVRPAQEFKWQLSQLTAALGQFPHLVIFSLDYWDPSDEKMIKKIYLEEKKQCIRPYVSTPDLGRIYPVPKSPDLGRIFPHPS